MCELLYLLGHGSREHDGLVLAGQQLGYREDIVRESHVEHAISLVKYKERKAREIDVSHTDMREQAAGSGNNDVRPHLEPLGFCVETGTVVAAIDGNAGDAVQVVAEPLHGLVYLLSQLARGSHDDAVDGILGVATVVEHGENGQQVGCRLACSCLCYAYDVALVKYFGDTSFLYRSHLLEVHVVECIKDVVVQICFFKCHVVAVANFSLFTFHSSLNSVPVYSRSML